MKLNEFVIKRQVVVLFLPLLTVIMYAVGTTFYNYWIGIGLVGVSILINSLVGKMLLNNAFTSLLEGKGLLAIDLNSTGILRPFIVNVQRPYIKGKEGDQEIEDIFSRDIVHQLAIPVVNKEPLVVNADDSIDLHLSSEALNNARFAMYHLPVLLYNSQLRTFYDKGVLSDLEKANYANNGLLYLNQKVCELSTHMRDFGRYVVENLKPKQSIFKNKVVMIIIIIVICILGALVAPQIINSMSGVFSSGSSVLSSVGESAGAVIPKG